MAQQLLSDEADRQLLRFLDAVTDHPDRKEFHLNLKVNDVGFRVATELATYLRGQGYTVKQERRRSLNRLVVTGGLLTNRPGRRRVCVGASQYLEAV